MISGSHALKINALVRTGSATTADFSMNHRKNPSASHSAVRMKNCGSEALNSSVSLTLAAGTVGSVMSAQPRARVAEHAQPRRIFAPLARVPRHLDGAEHALGVRHQDRHAA